MKNPAPSFQFYPADFLSDLNVMAMTDEEVGRYVKLMCHCWIEDGLPKDESRVVQQYLNNSPSIARCFYEKGGKYRHKRLDEERAKQLSWRLKCAKGGKTSAHNKQLSKGSSRVVQLKANTPSSSSSSSPNKKEPKKVLNISLIESFESWWNRYPRKLGKQDALKAWMAIAEKDGPEILNKALDGYIIELKKNATEEKFIKHPTTFLRNDRWRDYLNVMASVKVGENSREDTAGRASMERAAAYRRQLFTQGLPEAEINDKVAEFINQGATS